MRRSSAGPGCARSRPAADRKTTHCLREGGGGRAGCLKCFARKFYTIVTFVCGGRVVAARSAVVQGSAAPVCWGVTDRWEAGTGAGEDRVYALTSLPPMPASESNVTAHSAFSRHITAAAAGRRCWAAL